MTSWGGLMQGAFEQQAINGGGPHEPEPDALGAWDAGLDLAPISPRGWLLGTTFCRGFVSSLIAAGGTGKTAVRIAQMLSLATGRALTDEFVFKRCRVLLVSLEDDKDELRRRVRAAMQHHNISHEQVKGWLILSAPGNSAGKLKELSVKGALVDGALAQAIEAAVAQHSIDVVCLDPFVKSHGVNENANVEMDAVVATLTDLAMRLSIAVDIPHHVSKGTAEAGNADKGRGASSVKDGARLVYTLTTMSPLEAEHLGVPEAERRLHIRMDPAKVNLCPPAEAATWFKLVGVQLDNCTADYPAGDNVQTVDRWDPPKTWEGITAAIANRILSDIANGLPDDERYSSSPRAITRAAWPVVQKHLSNKTDKQCREVIKTWLKEGMIEEREYHSQKDRKELVGLFVNDAKRPGKGDE